MSITLGCVKRQACQRNFMVCLCFQLTVYAIITVCPFLMDRILQRSENLHFIGSHPNELPIQIVLKHQYQQYCFITQEFKRGILLGDAFQSMIRNRLKSQVRFATKHFNQRGNSDFYCEEIIKMLTQSEWRITCWGDL